jgi:hypothetical protein
MPQYVLHLSVKKETYDLYMKRYEEIKGKDRKATHDDLMKSLLGMR